MDSLSESSLLRLPPELLIRISNHLATLDFGNLRRSCKYIERHLFDSFAREFFTKRQFMLEEHSLRALVDIAHHPTLSDHVKYVIIVPESLHYPGKDVQDNMSNRIDPDILLCTGQARDMLIEAFRNLPNLRTVGLRDYAAAGRLREGPGARWKSYGWSAGSLDPSRPVGSCHRSRGGNSLALPLILSALGGAEHTGIESVEVICRHAPYLEPRAFNVLSGSLGAAIAPVLANLSSMFLTLALDMSWPPRRSESPEGSAAATSLARFLHATPSLRFLRLNFSDHYSGHADIQFLEWLGLPVSAANHSPVASKISVAPIALSDLRGLEIGMTVVPGPTLLAALTKFNLHSFSLWRIVMLYEYANDRRSAAKQCWPQFLHSLAVSMPSDSALQSIKIGETKQIPKNDQDQTSPSHVQFFPEGSTEDTPGRPRLSTATYCARFGTSAKHWLKELADRLYVESEQHDSAIVTDDESDSSMDDASDFEDDGDAELEDAESEPFTASQTALQQILAPE